MKKIRFIVLALCLAVLFAVPVQAASDISEINEGDSKQTLTFVNPIYSHITAPAGEQAAGASVEQKTLSATRYSSPSAAASYMKNQMVNRKSTVSFIVYSTNSQWDSVFNEVLEAACKYTTTAKPYEGDYLKWHFYSFNSFYNSVSDIRQKSGSGYYYTFYGYMEYMSTASQENAVAQKISTVLSSLKVSSMRTEYQKIAAIYEYVTSHVTYDNAHVNNESYLPQYSAYAAIVKGTAVCQGYANLIYRMMRQAGLSVRFIGGTSYNIPHAWNIVRVNGKYYNLDSTWDAGYSSDNYGWFLLGSLQFTSHTRDGEFNTTAFTTAYPTSTISFRGTDSAPVTYKITYKLNGGSNHASNPSSYFGKAVKLASPSRKGYSFAGWYTNKAMTNSIKTIPAYATKNYTLYAKWTKISVKQGVISYFKNEQGRLRVRVGKVSGATGYRIEYSRKKGFNSGTVKYSYTKSSNESVKVKVSDADKRYYVRVRAYKVDSAGKRVYGKASAAVTGYKITYNLKSGVNDTGNPYYYYRRGTVLQTPVRAGYRFLGWYTDAKCTKKISTISKNSDKNYILYAKWEKIAS